MSWMMLGSTSRKETKPPESDWAWALEEIAVNTIAIRIDFTRSIHIVMAGLVPAIHALFAAAMQERGCPGHRRAEATPSSGRLCPGMTDRCGSRLRRDVKTDQGITHRLGIGPCPPSHPRL